MSFWGVLLWLFGTGYREWFTEEYARQKAPQAWEIDETRFVGFPESRAFQRYP